jgi:hypothetical protein
VHKMGGRTKRKIIKSKKTRKSRHR